MPQRTARPPRVCRYKVQDQMYFLLIARLEPENNIEMVLDGFLNSNSSLSFLVVGNTQTNYGHFLVERYTDSRIVFLGSIFDKSHLESLRRFSKGYFHGHSVGGTNPALLEDSPERKEANESGWEIAYDTMEIKI